LFAILALALSGFSVAAYMGRFVLPPAQAGFVELGGGFMNIVGWFCFLFCLRAIAEALKERDLMDDIKMLMVWLGIYIGCFVVMFLFSCLVSGLMVGSAMTTRNQESAGAGALVLGIVGCFFVIAMAIFGIVLFVRYVIILFRVRGAIGYKIG